MVLPLISDGSLPSLAWGLFFKHAQSSARALRSLLQISGSLPLSGQLPLPWNSAPQILDTVASQNVLLFSEATETAGLPLCVPLHPFGSQELHSGWNLERPWGSPLSVSFPLKNPSPVLPIVESENCFITWFVQFFKKICLMWTVFKVLIELATVLLLFCFGFLTVRRVAP